MRRNSIAFFVLLTATAPIAAQAPSANDLVETDIVFGKGGEQDLKLDLAVPKEGKGPFPAIVCVHGGAWRGGSRTQLSVTIRELASRGFVAATVQHRLCPQCTFPAQIEDCKCAVRYLRAHAEKLRIDPNRIGALGFSSGGHLACLLGLTNGQDGLEGQGDLSAAQAKQSSRVQVVVSFFAPTDITRNDWKTEVQPLLTDLLGGTFEQKKAAYLKASPITYVRKDNPPPPFLLFHGTEDPLVPYVQSIRLRDALLGVGGKVELVTMEGEAHGWRGEKLKKSVDQTIQFFETHLKK